MCEWAAKCANACVIERVSAILYPVQVGVGVKGGAEAAVHAVRRFLDDMSDYYRDKVVVKLDFKNAFNCLRRDRMLEAVQEWIPELYAFCYNAYTCHPLIICSAIQQSNRLQVFSRGTLWDRCCSASR